MKPRIYFYPTVVSNRHNGLGWVLPHQPLRELLKKTSSSSVSSCKVIKHFNSSFRTIFFPQKPWLAATLTHVIHQTQDHRGAYLQHPDRSGQHSNRDYQKGLSRPEEEVKKDLFVNEQ
jgi:hypothetical protein